MENARDSMVSRSDFHLAHQSMKKALMNHCECRRSFMRAIAAFMMGAGIRRDIHNPNKAAASTSKEAGSGMSAMGIDLKSGPAIRETEISTGTDGPGSLSNWGVTTSRVTSCDAPEVSWLSVPEFSAALPDDEKIPPFGEKAPPNPSTLPEALASSTNPLTSAFPPGASHPDGDTVVPEGAIAAAPRLTAIEIFLQTAPTIALAGLGTWWIDDTAA